MKKIIFHARTRLAAAIAPPVAELEAAAPVKWSPPDESEAVTVIERTLPPLPRQARRVLDLRNIQLREWLLIIARTCDNEAEARRLALRQLGQGGRIPSERVAHGVVQLVRYRRQHGWTFFQVAIGDMETAVVSEVTAA